jgi:single-stranded-DNA-specific exonuclease
MNVLLSNRGAPPTFLDGSLKDLEPHLTIQGIAEGAELMAWHLRRGHKLVLVGDYDCDGVTSAALLSIFLRDIGYVDFEVVIPHRSEGYGIPKRAVFQHADAKLLVAVDCGTQDRDAIALSQAYGMDSLVIDHHEVNAQHLAPVNVLINPKQPTCSSSFKEFSSAGLTLLFLAGLRRALRGSFRSPSLGPKYLSLAAIGTIADIVPLIDGNRILAKAGIYHLSKSDFLPLQQIIQAAGLANKAITAGHVGYQLAPRLNVAGRMASAQLALDLLTGDDPQDLQNLAQELNRLNAKRQHLERSVMEEVKSRYTAAYAARRTLVMGDSGWHPGIIGIVASKIQQELHFGPTVIFSIDEELQIARGSARSVSGFDIHAALKRCDSLLLRWGGHKMAAGLTISPANLDAFSQLFEEVARGCPSHIFVPERKVDLELDLHLVSDQLLEALAVLEPHGAGNPRPTFAAKKARLRVQKIFGKDQNHLRISLQGKVAGVFWNGRNRLLSDLDGGADVIFQLEKDDFLNKPILNIKDIGRFFDVG